MTNLVILVGRIARDPETRTTGGGTGITSISVATNRPARKEGKTYKDENGYTAKDSEFHRITCFNGLGQNVAKYCTKGQLVTVEARQREPAAEALQDARADLSPVIPGMNSPERAGEVAPSVPASEGEVAAALAQSTALPTGSSESQEKGPEEAPRSDAPRFVKPAGEAKPDIRLGVPSAPVEARKLMLEDGLSEPDDPARDERGIGEADMEI